MQSPNKKFGFHTLNMHSGRVFKRRCFTVFCFPEGKNWKYSFLTRFLYFDYPCCVTAIHLSICSRRRRFRSSSAAADALEMERAPGVYLFAARTRLQARAVGGLKKVRAVINHQPTREKQTLL
jgi:hypothetical protein